MARVKLGGLAQDVRGTLNGNVFSRNRGGAYVRTKVSPIQPVSPFRSFAQMLFAAVSMAWSTDLNDVQRAAWEAFAAVHPFVNVFGDAIVLSGIAFYQSVNRRLLQIGEARIDSPPLTFDVADIVSVTADAEADNVGNLTLNIEIGRALTGDELLYVFATSPLLGARTAQKNNFRLVNNSANGGYASPSNIGPDYLTRFPDVTVINGSRIALRVQAVNVVTGAASAPVYTEIIATAIPGPLVQLNAFYATDSGGGNVTRGYITATPHGLTTGQTVQVVCDPANVQMDEPGAACTVTSPDTFEFAPSVGGPVNVTPHDGTIQRTA